MATKFLLDGKWPSLVCLEAVGSADEAPPLVVESPPTRGGFTRQGRCSTHAQPDATRALATQLEDCDWLVRKNAVGTLGKLEPATLGLLADAVIARLDDSNRHVRAAALDTPGKFEPAALALHANAVVAKLEDTDAAVRVAALQTLGKLEPATLALHANAVVAKLEDSDFSVRVVALWTLGKLEPAALAQHAEAVLARLDDFLGTVPLAALAALSALPRYVMCGIGLDSDDLQPRLRLGVPGTTESLRLAAAGASAVVQVPAPLACATPCVWYALPYGPNGPGHARDVEAWDRMTMMIKA